MYTIMLVKLIKHHLFYIVSEHEFEDLEDTEDTDSDNPTEEIYDLAKSLKIYIFSLLERSSQQCKHKKSGLPWQALLLYLCRDACFEIALRKAFTVIANTMYNNLIIYIIYIIYVRINILDFFIFNTKGHQEKKL